MKQGPIVKNCADSLFIGKSMSKMDIRDGRKSSGSYSAPQYEFDLTKPLEKFIPILRDEERYAKAFGMLRALGESGSKGNEKAVYVLEVEGRDIAKIGVSFDPLNRFADIQAGHYRKLHLHAVLFCPTRKSVSIEQAVLQRALEAGKRLNGEWVAMSAPDTLMLALEVARDNNWPICDGQTWFENMAAKTYALASSRRFRKRY